MRKILFRGKRIDNGEWVKGGYLNQKYSEPRIWRNNCGIKVDLESIGQYTGINDSNNIEIFENDFVRVISAIPGDLEQELGKRTEFEGKVVFLEGAWVVDNGSNAIPLFNETAEVFVIADNKNLSEYGEIIVNIQNQIRRLIISKLTAKRIIIDTKTLKVLKGANSSITMSKEFETVCGLPFVEVESNKEVIVVEFEER